MARQHGVFLASGFTELADDRDKVFNSGLLVGPDGQLLLHYQKQFLATHDHNWFEVGVRSLRWWTPEIGGLGLLICFDGRIPEIARCLALQGAEVIVDMANFFAMKPSFGCQPAPTRTAFGSSPPPSRAWSAAFTTQEAA